MGASASAFATIKRPAFTASAGLVWMWRPDVVMSDAADLVEVHTLKVGEAERLPQPNCMLVGLNDRVELHRRVLTSTATACPTPLASCGRWEMKPAVAT